MQDLNNSSVDLENQLRQLQRLNLQMKIELDEKQIQMDQLESLHEIEVQKISIQLKNLSEELNETGKLKQESEIRSKRIIESLSIQNRDLTIGLNNANQKSQLEIQKTRGSFAKRSSFIAIAMLNRISFKDNDFEDHSRGNTHRESGTDTNKSKEDRSRMSGCSPLINRTPNPWKDNSNGRKTPTDHRPSFNNSTSDDKSAQKTKRNQNRGNEKSKLNKSKLNDVSEKSSLRSKSADSIKTQNSKSVSSAKMKQLFSKIHPNLPGFNPKKAVSNESNQIGILKIIEELQYILKCEEIEKKQIINEHSKTLEKLAQTEHFQVELNQKMFAMEQEKIDLYHQIDIFKNMAADYQEKWQNILKKNSKIEVRLSQINIDKILEQSELEILKSENANLKTKIIDLQIHINQKDFSETENYQNFQLEKKQLKMRKFRFRCSRPIWTSFIPKIATWRKKPGISPEKSTWFLFNLPSRNKSRHS